MAFSGVSATYQDPVGSFSKRVDYEIGVHHAGAHNADYATVWGIMKPGDASQVRSGIGAPVAQKSENQRFKLFAHLPVRSF